MVIRLRRGALCAVIAALLTAGASSPVHAAGVSIFEQGARGMGFASAFTAVANDPSAIYYNAGGIGFLKGKRLYFGGAMQWPSFDFAGADPFPGTTSTATSDSSRIDMVQGLLHPPVLGTHGLRPGLPHPVRPEDGLGRPRPLPRPLHRPDHEPQVHVGEPHGRLQARRSVQRGGGAGLPSGPPRHAPEDPAHQSLYPAGGRRRRANIDTDTATGIGFNIGVLARPSDEWSVGLAYRHKVSVDFSGGTVYDIIPTGNTQLDTLVAATLPQGTTPLTTTLTFPGSFSGGLAYDTDNWTFSGQADYTQWSTFDTLAIVYPTRPELSQTITQAYTNTWDFPAGGRTGGSRESGRCVPGTRTSPLRCRRVGVAVPSRLEPERRERGRVLDERAGAPRPRAGTPSGA